MGLVAPKPLLVALATLGLALAACGGSEPADVEGVTPTVAAEVEPSPTTFATLTPTSVVVATPTLEATAIPPSPTVTAQTTLPSPSPVVVDLTATPAPPTPVSTIASPSPTATALLIQTPTVIPPSTPTVRPSPTPTEGPVQPAQEIAVIENLASSSYYPLKIVMTKGPVKLYITRLYREHRNQFNVGPFLMQAAHWPPGQVGTILFEVESVGRFLFENVGHGFASPLVVVESEEEMRSTRAEDGVQEFALIHDLDGGVIYPDRIVVQKGIPVRIHNISLDGEEHVFIDQFIEAVGVDIQPRRVTAFEFTPVEEGEYTIRYDDHSATAKLVVE